MGHTSSRGRRGKLSERPKRRGTKSKRWYEPVWGVSALRGGCVPRAASPLLNAAVRGRASRRTHPAGDRKSLRFVSSHHSPRIQRDFKSCDLVLFSGAKSVVSVAFDLFFFYLALFVVVVEIFPCYTPSLANERFFFHSCPQGVKGGKEKNHFVRNCRQISFLQALN